MNEGHLLTAEVLAAGARAYASFAANRLVERNPEVNAQFGTGAFQNWQDHFCRQIIELSAAVAEAEPRLFSARIDWSRNAFQAREVSEEILKWSLRCLREVLDEELPEQQSNTVRDYLDLALQSFDQSVHQDKENPAAGGLSQLALKYLETALQGDSRSAIQVVLNAAQEGMEVAKLYEDVLLAAQQAIGEMWHNAEVSVAEEHYVSSTTLRTMAVLCHAAQPKRPLGLSVVAAAVEQNAHDIGIRAVSDFFELAGWNAICLGGNSPPAEVAHVVEIFRSPLLLLSASLCTQIKSLRETIRLVRGLNTNCKIVVGGAAFRDVPDHWKRVGADACALSARDALEQGTRLVNP